MRRRANDWSSLVQKILVEAIEDKAGGNESEAARLSGYPQRTINRWASGVSSPKAEDLFAFLDALGENPPQRFCQQTQRQNGTVCLRVSKDQADAIKKLLDR